LQMIGERLAGDAVGAADVNLACTLNRDGALGRDIDRLQVPVAQATKVAHAAVLACLGNSDAHARVLRALTSASDADVQIAQVYVHHRPLADAAELRGVASGVARMSGSDAQVPALDTLARLRLRAPRT